jgi:hypothetical protein
MTRPTHARLAGFLLLLYIAVGIVAMVLFDQAAGAAGIGGKLASIEQHLPHTRAALMLTLLTIPIALGLAVSLYVLTRESAPDLAVLALCCRVGEGLLNAVPTLALAGLLWLGTTAAAAGPDTEAAAQALAALLLKTRAWGTTIGATLFAFGSGLFSYLFLRGRSIPAALAWLGILSSAPLVVGLPAQLAGILEGPLTLLMWLPMLVFELALALLLLVKGVADQP